MRAKVDDLHVGQKWSKSINSWENRSWIGMDRIHWMALLDIEFQPFSGKSQSVFGEIPENGQAFTAQIARSGEILTYYWPLVMFSSSPLFQRLCLCRGAPLAPLMLPSEEQIGAGQPGPIASRENDEKCRVHIGFIFGGTPKWMVQTSCHLCHSYADSSRCHLIYLGISWDATICNPRQFRQLALQGLSKYHDKNPYAFGDGPPLQYDPAEADLVLVGTGWWFQMRRSVD